MNEPDNEMPQIQMPAPPSQFSIMTRRIVEMLITAAVRGFLFFLIWNSCLSQELHLPLLSFSFCFLTIIAIQILFFSTVMQRMSWQLNFLQNSVDQIQNTMVFEATRKIIIQAQAAVDKENSEKKSSPDT